MASKNSRRALWIVASLLLGGAVVWWLLPEAVPVDGAVVARGALEEVIEDDGEARVRDRYVISAPLAGRQARLTLRAGDEVTVGRVVARLDLLPLDERARAQAEARLESALDGQRAAAAVVRQAEAALDQARRDLDRAQALARDGVAPPETREKAELALELRAKERENAAFRARAAAHEVEVARAALLAATPNGGGGAERALEITAPTAGRVLRVVSESARVVAAGEPLLEIGDPANLEIVVDLLSSEAARVRPGDALRLEDWGGGKALRGRVRVVEPSAFTKISALGIEEQRVNVVGDLLDPAPGLADRYRVRVKVVTWQAEGVLQVPWSALFRSGGDWQVFVVEDGRARLRPVTIGHQGAFETEILDGLAEGDLVVRHPTDQVRDGVRVEVAKR